MSSFRWENTPTDAFTQLFDGYDQYIHNGVKQIADYFAPQIEAWMKQNAPWTDRTGNARQTLHAEVVQVAGEMVAITFDHGMEYGLWLEVSNAGTYAIITPALDHWGPKVFAAVRELLS